MKISTITNDHLFESTIRKHSIYQDFYHVGHLLIERRLTEPQIQDLFKSIEQTASAGGQNRTMIGRGKDVVTDVGSAIANAYRGVAEKISRSGPVSGFDVAVDKLSDRIKAAAGGDGGQAMTYINRYRQFAKRHPVMQGAIYAGLIAAAGLSGAGLGGAAILGGLKAFDKMLLGNKASSALWSGFVTGAAAYGLQQASQAMASAGQSAAAASTPTIDIAGTGQSADATVSATNTAGTAQGVPLDNAPIAPAGADSFDYSQSSDFNTAFRNARAEIGPGGAFEWKGRLYSTNLQAEGLPNAAQLKTLIQQQMQGLTPDFTAGVRSFNKESRDFAIIKPLPLRRLIDREATVWNWQLNESLDRKRGGLHFRISGVDHVFRLIEQSVMELDVKGARAQDILARRGKISQKGARTLSTTADALPAQQAVSPAAATDTDATPEYLRPSRPGAPLPAEKSGIMSRIGQGLQTFGRQLTTKITAEKLNTNWKVAGSPTDSDQLYNFLIKQGVPQEVANKVWTDLKLTIPGGAATATTGASPVAATDDIKMTADDIVAQIKGVWDKITANQANPIGAPAVKNLLKNMWMQSGGTQAKESRERQERQMIERVIREVRHKQRKQIERQERRA